MESKHTHADTRTHAGARGARANVRQPHNGEPVHFEVVLRAQREVLATMERRFFRKFLESPLYNDYRRDRIATGYAGECCVGLASGSRA